MDFYEKKFKTYAKKLGYNTFKIESKKGWPDFLVYNKKRMFFAEIKGSKSKKNISESQFSGEQLELLSLYKSFCTIYFYNKDKNWSTYKYDILEGFMELNGNST